MCYAGSCNPECDNCKPKYLACPQCGTRIALAFKHCPLCKCAISESDREKARQDWQKTHIGKSL